MCVLINVHPEWGFECLFMGWEEGDSDGIGDDQLSLWVKLWPHDQMHGRCKW